MSDDQSDVPTVCMESQSEAIARKHARQLARYRERVIEEIGWAVAAENARHKERIDAEIRRHKAALYGYERELERYNNQMNEGGKTA